MPHASHDFPDCFSARADDYARYRPRYPDALYDRLVSWVPQRDQCWDCATGNGQAAVALTRFFDKVVATDASAGQLAQAFPHPRVEYRCELAERTSLADHSVDLVTVAAALHWLDLSAFYREVTRVLRPGGVFAAWTYAAHVEATPAVEAVIVRYMRDVLGPYTRPELQHVSRQYRDLRMPFPEVEVAPVAIEVEWTLSQLVGLLNTWSSAVEYRRQRGHLATDTVLSELTAAWARDNDVGEPVPMRLPLYVRVARSPG